MRVRRRDEEYPDRPDYGCALQKEILVQGRIYVSEHHLCFSANIFGWVTSVRQSSGSSRMRGCRCERRLRCIQVRQLTTQQLVIPFAEVVTIEKRMTAYVIPNAISVATLHQRVRRCSG